MIFEGKAQQFKNIKKNKVKKIVVMMEVVALRSHLPCGFEEMGIGRIRKRLKRCVALHVTTGFFNE